MKSGNRSWSWLAASLILLFGPLLILFYVIDPYLKRTPNIDAPVIFLCYSFVVLFGTVLSVVAFARWLRKKNQVDEPIDLDIQD